MADVFAAEIAERPHDWHMLQRLWVADLPAPTPAPAPPRPPAAIVPGEG
jgi:KDO2-lipid IV(A) lauroyltransferase